MTEAQLRIKVGLFLITSHLFIIILLIIMYLIGGFLFEEMTTAIALIIPMFSIYTTAIIKYILANKNQTTDSSNLVNTAYNFVAYFIPAIFVFFIISIIALKAFSIGFSSFEHFKIMLAIGETAFGTYAGLVLTSLYNIDKRGVR